MGAVEVTFDGEMSELKNSLDGLSSYVHGWGSKIAAIGAAAFAFVGIKELLGFGEEFISKASEAAQVDAKLGAVLEASGHAAGFSADQLSKMATALEHVTLFDDEAVKGAETMIATFSEIRGDQFERTTKLALDMATVMGGDASSAASELAKALNDPLRGMQLLQRQGVLLTEAQQKHIESMVKSGDVAGAQGILLDEMSKKYGGAAEAAAGAAGGGMKQFWNIVDDIKEALGGGLLAVLDPLMPLFKEGALAVQGWAESFAELGPTISDGVVGALGVLEKRFDFLLDVGSTVLGSLGDLWNSTFGNALGPVTSLFDLVKSGYNTLIEAEVAFITAFEVGFQSMPDVADLAWTSIKLGAVTMFNDIEFFLTDTLPTALNWFADNWQDVFTDIVNFTATIFKNLSHNIYEIITHIPDLIKGNMSFADLWTPVTDGFVSSIKQLPEFASRELTPLEKELGDHVGKISTNLNDKYQKKLSENRKTLGWDDTATGGDEEMAFLVGSAGGEKKAPARADRSGDGKKEKQDKGAQFEDLGSLFKRIQSAAAGGTPEQKEAKKTADATTEMKDHTRASKDHLATIAQHLEEIKKNTANPKGATFLA